MTKTRIAMYLRLSKEDDKIKSESNSIKMQRLLITDYVQNHFTYYKLEEFVDDGFTGTNFNRPGMTCLLEKARKGTIDCIIVKDFSRFARDYIELGSYLEQIFPFLNIRFISVNDKYDSDSVMGRNPGLDVNFSNLLYDYYSKDISQKVSTSFAARKAEGQYLSANSPFGYQKDPKDRHRLIIKEDEAEIVRRIFDMALQGKTVNQIAKVLNTEELKTPIEFKIEMGETFRTPKGDRFCWNASTIASILRNRIYVGDIVYGKTKKNHVGGKNVLIPRSEWKVFCDHHEAIISKELFEQIQSTRGRKAASRNMAPKTVLRGMVICSHCRSSLRYRDGLNPYFTCPERYCTDDPDCCRKINVMFLEQVVLCEMEQYLIRQGVLDECSSWREKDILCEIAEINDKITEQKREYDRGKKLNYDNYQLYVTGESEEFSSLSNALAQIKIHIKELVEHEKSLREKLSTEHCAKIELNRELLEQYIKCILVKDEENFEIIWKDKI